MKEKIIETIRAVPIAGKTYEEYVEAVAEKLIDVGVIVPPCKVGDTVYWAFYDKGEEIAEVFEGFIRGLSIGHNGTAWFSVVYNNGLTYEHTFKDYWNNTVFLTREEAENALKGANDADR